VARLSYDVTERRLKREFEEYGPIKSIRLVHDKNSGAAALLFCGLLCLA
jgi:U1 small nuclear ribonucleoprotein